MYRATLFIISAPSGAGKSSLINAYLKQLNSTPSNLPPARVSISHTTRLPRPGENHGEHYYFVKYDEFEDLIVQDAFVEYAKVFDNYYGTSKTAIEQNLQNGINTFLDIDWQGAKQVREKFPSAKSIFIFPPSLAELENRLFNRRQDSPAIIHQRMQKAKAEMSHYDEYDYLIINDQFELSLHQLSAIITAESLRTHKQKIGNNNTINQMIE